MSFLYINSDTKTYLINSNQPELTYQSICQVMKS